MQTKKFNIDSGWQVLLSDVGIDPADLLRRARLPEDLFHRKDAALEPDDFFRFWQAMEESFDDPTFPLKLVSAFSAETFDPAVFAAFCSPNLNTALQRLSRFKPLLAPMKLHVSVDREQTGVEVEYPEGCTLPATFAATEMLFFVHLARTGTRKEVVPLAVETPVDLPAINMYSQAIGVIPVIGERVKVVFAANDASCPFVAANEKMWEHFEPMLRQRLADLDNSASFTERVRAVLLELLPSGQSSIQAVANRLLISSRTLQRRLNKEGTNYQTVLNQVREQLARHYLTQTEMNGAQISYLLGY
ncbi:MAG: AraC family transcriptional regulator, partial [Gammaproteobacteria bacterium]